MNNQSKFFRKPMQLFLFFVSIMFLIGFKQNIFLQDYKIDSNQVKLNQILKKTGSYCEKVKKIALFYICREKIVKKKFFYSTENVKKRIPNSVAWEWKKILKVRGTKKNTYTYDYQLIKKERELKEKRILLEEDGKKKHEENAELKMTKYVSKYLVFGPVGFMSKYWQDHFDYEIVGEEKVDGKEAIIIRSSPKSVIEENDNYGRIWVDEKDCSILKIEWDSRSIRDYDEGPISSPIGDLKKEMIWSVSYGVEKNGVRFPSKQLIQEIFINKEGEKIIQREILFIYDEYQFFIVEVDVKYKP